MAALLLKLTFLLKKINFMLAKTSFQNGNSVSGNHKIKINILPHLSYEPLPLRGKEGASTPQSCFFMPIEGMKKLAGPSLP